MNTRITQVSVIIVVKNDRGIDTTLERIQASQAYVPFETIVVDASEPTQLADIRNEYPQVIWDQFPVSNRRTTPEQRNRGIELAHGDAIVFIDANCVPVDGWLEAIITSLEKGESIVCGPVLDLSKNNLVHYAPTLAEAGYIDVCTTINVGFRKTVVDKIGLFDTSFSFGQDIDFFWRATEAGFKIYYNPAIAIGHDWGERNEQLRRAFDYGKARAHLFKKHWRTRKKELIHEPHVWLYPLFIIFLPITFFFPFYPLLIFIPVLKNLNKNPLGLILHHLSYGLGVIAGTLKAWPKS